jgi:hypothetical protein
VHYLLIHQLSVSVATLKNHGEIVLIGTFIRVENALLPIVKTVSTSLIVIAMRTIARSAMNTIGNAQILLQYSSALTKLEIKNAQQFVSTIGTQKLTQ